MANHADPRLPCSQTNPVLVDLSTRLTVSGANVFIDVAGLLANHTLYEVLVPANRTVRSLVGVEFGGITKPREWLFFTGAGAAGETGPRAVSFGPVGKVAAPSVTGVTVDWDELVFWPGDNSSAPPGVEVLPCPVGSGRSHLPSAEIPVFASLHDRSQLGTPILLTGPSSGWGSNSTSFSLGVGDNLAVATGYDANVPSSAEAAPTVVFDALCRPNPIRVDWLFATQGWLALCVLRVFAWLSFWWRLSD